MTHLQSVFGTLAESNQQQSSQPNFCQQKPNGLFGQQTNLCQQLQQPQPQQQPCTNPYLPQNQVQTSMPCQNSFAQMMPPTPPQQQQPTACYLPPNVLEQLRCLTNNTTPIFILPAGLTSSSNTSTPCMTPCFSPTCIPYPMPLPVYHHFGTKSTSSSESICNCTSSTSRSKSQSSDPSSLEQYTGGLTWNSDQHVCKEGPDGAVCSKKNCPASIQLQAMISQLLAYQGVVPSAITRILLKRVPGANVGDSLDEIMEKAMRCIRQLPKDGLLRESCNSREVTKLLGLYLTSSSTLPRIIPVLTTVQLKCNILKALVENLVASRLLDEQRNSGVEADEPLDRLLLELKSEDQLRQMLAELREKECEERVNVNFASCASQKRLSEARLASVQRKIQQVEREIERRRCDLYANQGQCNNIRHSGDDSTSRVCGMSSDFPESPDPFEGVCLARFKRLNLKPHVGSPETTYEKMEECGKEKIEEKEVEVNDCGCVARDCDVASDAVGGTNVNGCQEEN